MDSIDIPVPDGGDVNIGGPMMRIIWILYGITVVVVGLRIFTQWKITCQLGLGDVMMSISVGFGLTLCACLTVQHHYGLGRHFYYLTAHQRVMALKYNFIGQPMGIMAPAFGRMACVLLMIQLFGMSRARKWSLWALFWGSLVANTLVVILVFVQCEHVETLWDPVGHPGRCWSPKVQEYTGFVQGGLNSAVDLFLTILPVTIFWSLKLSKYLKFGLGVLLSLSILAFIACVIKTFQLQSLGNRSDFTFNTVPFFTWVVVECALVSIAASVPLIRPLFTRFDRIRKGSKDSYEMERYGRTVTRKSVPLPSIDIGARAGSEENILHAETVHFGQSIVKKTDFMVTYHNEDGNEMNGEGDIQGRILGDGAWSDRRDIP